MKVRVVFAKRGEKKELALQEDERGRKNFWFTRKL